MKIASVGSLLQHSRRGSQPGHSSAQEPKIIKSTTAQAALPFLFLETSMFRQNQTRLHPLVNIIVLLGLAVFAFSIKRNTNNAQDLAFVTAGNPPDATATAVAPILTSGISAVLALGPRTSPVYGTSQQATSTETVKGSASPTFIGDQQLPHDATTAPQVIPPSATATTPSFVLIKQTIEPGTKLTALRTTNPQGLPLRYSVIRGAFPGTILLNSHGEFSGTAFASGNSSTEVLAVDDAGITTTINVVLIVQNASPRFGLTTSNSKQNLILGQVPVPLSAIDTNLERLTFNQDSQCLPDGLSLSSDGSFTGTAQQDGVFHCTIIVSDEHGTQASTSLQLNVGPIAATPEADQITEKNRPGLVEIPASTALKAPPANPGKAAPPSSQQKPGTPSGTVALALPRVNEAAQPKGNAKLPAPPAPLTSLAPPIPLKAPVSNAAGPTSSPGTSPGTSAGTSAGTSPERSVPSTSKQAGFEVLGPGEPLLAGPESPTTEVTGTRSRLDESPATNPSATPKF